MSNSLVNEEILRLQYITQIFDGYIVLGLIVIGTVGNLLNIFVFIRLKTLRRKSISVFLIGSFISSLVLLWSSRFPRCILSITGVDLLVSSIVYCKIRWLFGRWGLNMPFTCLCLTSIDRFLSTSRNARYRRFFTVRRAYLIVSIFSLAYLAICIPDSIYYSGYSCTASANARAVYKQFITSFDLSITNVLSVVVLGTFSLLTWYNLSLTRYNRHNQIQKQVNRMMLAEFTMVFITALPNFIFDIYSQITQFVEKSQLKLAQETLWTDVSVIISFTMNVGALYVYMIVSPAYRRNVRTALCLKRQNRVTWKEIELQNRTTGQQFGNITIRS
jgi:hypothetical protein